MKKTKRTLTSLLLITAILCLSFAVFGIVSGAATSGPVTDAPLTAGREFEDGEGIQLGKELGTMPRTYEAVVYLPKSVTTRGAILSNNFPIGGTSFIDLSISASGRPVLDMRDAKDNRTRVEFKQDIRNDSAWVHLVITHESRATADGGDIYTCYINGAKVTEQSVNYWVEGTKNSAGNLNMALDMSKLENAASMYLGQAAGYNSKTELGDGDPYNEGGVYTPTNFEGRIKNFVLYDKVLTADEVKYNYENGIVSNREGIKLCYDLTSPEARSGYITDLSGNGYNTVPLYHERTEELNPDDYDYSFAVLGDTQFLVDWDIKNGTSYYTDIYTWLVNNKDAKKIARVLGVGDIVESGRLDSGVTDAATRESAEAQWEYAVEQFKRLEDAGIPYTITFGYSHDGYEGEEFTTYFGNQKNFTDKTVGKYDEIGFYFSDSTNANYGKRLANYYQKFEVSGVKYMVMGIEFMPSDAVLAWADSVIDANRDHRVIITTHYYLDQYGEISPDTDTEYRLDGKPPRGEVLQKKWDILANENPNVEMILCGHIARQNNIVQRYTLAKSGQQVAQFLLDPQQLDRFLGYDDTGLIAMFYFSDNGDDVRVEFISASRTMRAVEENPAAEDILYGHRNEFTYEYSNLPEAEPEDVKTEYGTIPADYADAEKYPFVLFDSNKKFLGATDIFMGKKSATSAIGMAREALKANVWDSAKNTYGTNEISVIIYMRDDVTMGAEEYFSDIYQLQGKLTVDLGDYTLTAPENKCIFDTILNSWNGSGDASVFPTEINMINGDIIISGREVVQFCALSGGVDKSFTYTFEDITFKAIGATTNFIIKHKTTDNSVAANASPVINLIDCTLDLSTSTVASGKSVSVFTLAGSNKYTKATVNMHGGSIVGGSTPFKITTGESYGGKLTFLDNESGEFTTISASTATTGITSGKYNGGSLYFKKKSTSGDTVTYAPVIKASYGDIAYEIPYEYLSVNKYPFIIIDDTGAFVKGAEYFASDITRSSNASSYSALNYAKNHMKTKNASLWNGSGYNEGTVSSIVIMRRDYTLQNNSERSEEFANNSQFMGEVIIDLGGFTLAANPNNEKSIFNGTLKIWKEADSGIAGGVFDSVITVKNGNILIYSKALVGFGINDGAAGKRLSYNFDNINLKVKGSAVAVANSTSNKAQTGYASANFTDCSFDFTEAGTLTTQVNLFHLGDQYTNIKITVKGGEIIMGAKKFALTTGGSTGAGSLTFAKNSAGEYATLYTSCTLSGDAAKVNGGALTFVRQDGSTYVLIPSASMSLDFTPKASITLDSNLVLNIYIPNSEALLSAVISELDGFDLGDYALTEDGEYYLVPIALAANKAANTFTLVVTVEAEGMELRGSFTFSVIKYAEKLLKLDTINYEETLLAKDILAYVRSAYLYFDMEDKLAVTTEINKILGDYDKTELDRVASSASSDNDDIISGVTFVLDSTPSIRFYLPSGANANEYSFRIGSRVLDFKTGVESAQSEYSGLTYCDVSLLAYQMIEEITVEKGSSLASYHINTYYDGVDKGTLLCDVVTKFYNYCVSAATYRQSVLTGTSYNSLSAEIVNQGGAAGTVTFVIDDGQQATATFAKTMIEKYGDLKLTFAIKGNALATLTTKTENGVTEYVMNDGRYTYTVNETNLAFWLDIVKTGRAEVISHTFTHAFAGTNDDGGVFEYVKSNEDIIRTSSSMPKGSLSKEILATNQVLRELGVNETPLTLAHAGISVRTEDYTVNGKKITTYKTYFNEVLAKAIDDGLMIGARNTFTVSNDSQLANKIYTPADVYARRVTGVPAFMIEDWTDPVISQNASYQSDINSWKTHINNAMEQGGLAAFCIHNISDTQEGFHHIDESQAEELFKYAAESNVAVMNFTEAMMYYLEWNAASISTKLYKDEYIAVSISDGLDNDIYNEALTVKVYLPDAFSGTATLGGEALEVSTDANGSFVLVDVVPDTADVIINLK